MDAYRNLRSICIQRVLWAIFQRKTRRKLRNLTSGTLVAISCGWALRYGWVLWSEVCSGCGILGFYWLGGWTMTRKRLGGCQMDDRHGSRESFKGRPMLVSFITFPLPPHSPSFAPLRRLRFLLAILTPPVPLVTYPLILDP